MINEEENERTLVALVNDKEVENEGILITLLSD